MKMHRFEVFVIDHENMGVEACKEEVERSRYAFISAKSADTADIGDFEDSHELNRSGTPVERFNSYFATQPQAPQGAATPDLRGIDAGDVDDWLHLINHRLVKRDTILIQVCDIEKAMTPYENRAPKTETPEGEKQ